jgi:GNAT superfamily N-acetyltransferase
MDAAHTTPGSILLDELSAASAELTIASARELLLEYGRFVIAQPGAARFCFGSLEKEAERLPDSYLEQGGGCIVASVELQPAGFVAWRSLAPTSVVLPDAWEMKRLWVRPGARGHSLGRILSHAVLDRAAAVHRRAVYLDTAPASMATAHRLYLDLGFEPCAAYNDNPVEGLAYLVKYL